MLCLRAMLCAPPLTPPPLLTIYAPESVTARSRERYENIGWPDHCCKACWGHPLEGDAESTAHDEARLRHQTIRPGKRKRSPMSWDLLIPERRSR
eukprot:1960839-Pyramimonas_sp.AAC.1